MAFYIFGHLQIRRADPTAVLSLPQRGVARPYFFDSYSINDSYIKIHFYILIFSASSLNGQQGVSRGGDRCAQQGLARGPQGGDAARLEAGRERPGAGRHALRPPSSSFDPINFFFLPFSRFFS